MKLIYIILILLFSSCKSENVTEERKFRQIISDSLNYKQAKINTTLLNLSDIDKGSDSIEIRLWSILAMTDLRFLTDLKYSDSTWGLTETTFWDAFSSDNSNAKLTELDSSVTKRKRPSIDFEKIIDSINYFQIQTLPSQHEIPNFVNRAADGVSYTLEISTKDYYKIVSYDNPNVYNDSSHRKFLKLLKFFNTNLGAFVSNY